ncbi:velvet factor [Purpureocillium lavendulum]|uniref:Velvet factor n=1 Tax=Purpureocillium lavendulum TaxID=1247861 RepID=A0AB34FP75_9HYPO|nr:velvet factor [Purpureocillium lavendulum]
MASASDEEKYHLGTTPDTLIRTGRRLSRQFFSGARAISVPESTKESTTYSTQHKYKGIHVRTNLAAAGNGGSYLEFPSLQPGWLTSNLPYPGCGGPALAPEDPQQYPLEQHHHHQQERQQQQRYGFPGDPQRQLTLRQAPIHARVTIGNEIDRKPIDPPPIVQLLDHRAYGKSEMYNSPYLFVTSTLVPETYGEPSNDQDVPTNNLVGSLASSIHQLRDTDNVEGGFFIFGDLSVKREGRFRLLFTLYERDHHSAIPSFNYVSELVTNTFTVYSTKRFPGMTGTTPLTRVFSDQGVKVRLRRDSGAMAARKRNRSATEATLYDFERPPKRPYCD